MASDRDIIHSMTCSVDPNMASDRDIIHSMTCGVDPIWHQTGILYTV